jgi:hypothetical protein
MRVAGSRTDNNVPTIAPMPTPTINNRRAYNRVLAMGFNRVFRDTRLPIFGNACFCTRTVFDFPVLGLKDEVCPVCGIGLTAVGITTPDLDLCAPPAIAGGMTLLFTRAKPPGALAVGCCGLGTLTFFCPALGTFGEFWRRFKG